jgi:hypothetical protein
MFREPYDFPGDFPGRENLFDVFPDAGNLSLKFLPGMVDK